MKQLSQVIVTALVIGFVQVSMPAAAFADQTPLQRKVDRLSGAEIRVYPGQRPGKDVRIEFQDPSVLVRKELVGTTSVTTIVAGRERVSLSISRAGLVVTRGDNQITADAAHPGGIEAARTLVAESPAIRSASAMLGRLAAAQDSTIGHTARVTRATLLAVSGEAAGARELSKWARSAREELLVKPVSVEQGPTDCWLLYAAEAISAYLEYEDCTSQLSWYELLDLFGCALIYDLRAIGAFSWWVGCVSLRG